MRYVFSGQCWWCSCYQTHSLCVYLCEWDETNPRLLRLLQLQHPFGPGQVVHLLEGLHLSPEGAAAGVFERVVGGGVVCWARLHGEAGLQGYRRWKRLAAGGSITADCAAGARVEAPGSCPDLQEHQLVSVMSSRHTSGEDNTDLRGFRDKWWRRAGVPLHLFARRLL